MPVNTPALHFDGHPRYLGALPPRPVQPLPRFAAARVVLPSTQWQEIDLSAFGAPILDQDGQNSCFPAGTLILMADGSRRPIEAVEPGDMVVTHERQACRVLARSARLYTGQMCELRPLFLDHPVVCTADHPIAVPAKQGLKWVPAANLETGDPLLLRLGRPGPDEVAGSEVDTSTAQVWRINSWLKAASSRPVQGVTVYNLEVEEDHSYVANGLVVHNCVGHGAATAAAIAWLQKGEALIRFAAGFIYAQINNNRDEGAVVADAMTELLSTGVCTEQEVPEGIIYQQQIPRSAYTTAARYKLAVAYHCGSWEEVCTALSLGYPVVGGWLLGQNFMNPGPSAVAPVPDRVVGGHCMCLVGLRRVNEAWLCKLQNSWGQRWGQGGWGFMGQDFFNYTARQYGQVDCFAVQAMAEDPQEQPGPVAT